MAPTSNASDAADAQPSRAPSPRPSPRHLRRPSSSLSSGPQRLPRTPAPADAAALAALHSELEAEQEAQVNRLLQLMRAQARAAAGDEAVQALRRENEVLRRRVRELEAVVAGLQGGAAQV